jgi:hypothetical protein
LKPKRPARIAPRSIPIRIAVSVETARPSTPAKPSHGSAMTMATRMASPVNGLFMKTTCPTPRRQESTNSSGGLPSARSAATGIVPSITDSPRGETPAEVLIGVPPPLPADRPNPLP